MKIKRYGTKGFDSVHPDHWQKQGRRNLLAHRKFVAAVVIVLVLVVACGNTGPTATVIAPSAMPAPLKATAIPPTATSALPMATAIPPSVTPGPTATPTGDGVTNGWAVLAERDSYADIGKTDLILDYVNIKRLHQLLLRQGWQPDQIQELREFGRQDLREGLDWLAKNADADDIILLYVAAHGSYLRDDIGWSDFLATDWAALPGGQRVLIVDSCTAAVFTAAVEDDPNPYLSIAAVDADEYGWCGLEEEGLPIIGSIFTYYFAAAFDEPGADDDGDALVSVQEAALIAEEQQRVYFHQVVLAVPEFMEMYHETGAFPEKDPDYPHVVIDDAIGAPLYLVVDTGDPAEAAGQDAPEEFEGKFDVGGYEIYLHCAGAGAPTVVLEAGYDDVAETWSLVQPKVATFTRACAYDRAGLGQSDPGPEPRNSLHMVKELHALLDEAGVEGSYVLVGHSLGGMYMRLFADRYPEDIVGLVLVDSSHIDQFQRNAAVLPSESPDESESLKFYREWFTNPPAYPTLHRRLFEPGSLGDMPLVVLTSPVKERADDLPAGLSAKFDEVWVELQKEWAKISSHSTHVMAYGSGHFIQHDQPDLVTDAILQVVEKVRPTETAPPFLGDSWTRPADGATMVFVPGGTFQMGSTQAETEAAFELCEQYRGEGHCRGVLFEDETPAHRVSLDSFWIDRTEVTNAQYDLCVETGGCRPVDCENEFPIDGSAKPVGCVTWPDAQAYCLWAGARLPTEAEWEYAARGPDGYIFPWGDAFDPARLNYCDINCTYKWQDRSHDDGYSWPAPVGSFESGVSWCGAQDMAGNAWEWVADWYVFGYYANSPAYNPQGPDAGSERVIRGGSAHFFPAYQRSANRSGILPLAIYASGGFRCAAGVSLYSPQVLKARRIPIRQGNQAEMSFGD